MIHELAVTAETDPEAFTKLFRKKLMTGGAVVTIPADISPEACVQIADKFVPRAVEHSIAADVCRALARHQHAPAELLERLGALELPLVVREIQRRSHGA